MGLPSTEPSALLVLVAGPCIPWPDYCAWRRARPCNVRGSKHFAAGRSSPTMRNPMVNPRVAGSPAPGLQPSPHAALVGELRLAECLLQEPFLADDEPCLQDPGEHRYRQESAERPERHRDTGKQSRERSLPRQSGPRRLAKRLIRRSLGQLPLMGRDRGVLMHAVCTFRSRPQLIEYAWTLRATQWSLLYTSMRTKTFSHSRR